MNRPLTAVFAALESLLVVGIGVGVPVVSLTFLWAFQYGLQIDWSVFWRAGADVWLVGHGADLTLTLSKSAASATGISGAGAPILISIAALGFALTTFLLGARAGRRLAETNHRVVGSVAAIASFAVYAAIVTVTARQPSADVSLVQGTVFPTLFFGVPLLVAVEVNRRRRDQPPGVFVGLGLRAFDEIPKVGRVVAVAAIRSGLAVSVVVFAVAGLLVALLLATHYAAIIALFEGAHGGVLGGLALTIGQIALLPNVVAWAAAWLVGPGFAIGAGSSVSPLATTLGPMPAVPFLGALPASTSSFAFVGILVPVVASFVVVTLFRPALQRALGEVDSLLVRVIAGAATGVAAGLIIGVTAALSAGSAGPGRLAEVGPDAFAVGGFAALEIGVPAMLALMVRQPDWALSDLTVAVADRLPRREAEGGGAAGGAAVPAPEAPVKPQAAERDDAVADHDDLTSGLPSLADALDGETDRKR